MSRYEPGSPCWVDLGTPDVPAATRFYGDLFGWQTREGYGGYGFFLKDDAAVAGYGPLGQADRPPAWSMYVCVGAADRVAANVRDAGGRTLAEPMDVMAQGRMAVFADTEGAAFGVWQPGEFPGAGVIGEPGSFVWIELASRDLDAARRFYHQVFDWNVPTEPVAASGYREFDLKGREIGGMLPMGPQFPPDVPPNWLVYFAVTSCDDTADRVAGLGGRVLMPGTTVSAGRFAVLADPQGAAFGVLEMTGQG